MSDNNKL